jgi:hypothetical protein
MITKEHATENLFEMAAIELITGIEPKTYVVMLHADDPSKDRAAAMYDSEELPSPIDVSEYSVKFRNIFLKHKHACFQAIREKRSNMKSGG